MNPPKPTKEEIANAIKILTDAAKWDLEPLSIWVFSDHSARVKYAAIVAKGEDNVDRLLKLANAKLKQDAIPPG